MALVDPARAHECAEEDFMFNQIALSGVATLGFAMLALLTLTLVESKINDRTRRARVLSRSDSR